ncbi:MAG: hypothetical protein GF350_12280 [Chitinivibrionales bacterium]|nr:hypothetical protein [Chitinivibrionales bacterium]
MTLFRSSAVAIGLILCTIQDIRAFSSIEGTVRESICYGAEFGAPCYIAPVSVCSVMVITPISSRQFIGVTDSTGNYSIDSIPVSQNTPFTVIAYKQGYQDSQQEVTLIDHQTITADFYLQRTTGRVTVDPSDPTNEDSLQFSIYNENICCCAEYSNHSVTWNDTAIFLYYLVNDENCARCMCLMAGSTTMFESGPLPAGTYSIYKVENSFCTGDFCLPVAILPEKVGEITISGATQTVVSVQARPEETFRFIVRSSGAALRYAADKPATADVSIYSARGNMVKRLFSGALFFGEDIGWDYTGLNGSPVPPGNYFFVIRLESDTQMVLRCQVTGQR